MASYYNIDDILAEEELTQVKNLLDFTFLPHLDPDFIQGQPQRPRKATLQDNDDDAENDGHSMMDKEKMPQNHYLSEGTKFKMPLWSIKKWAEVGYVQFTFPKHYGRRARERLDADPVSVDLRNRNERFYLSGISLIDLVQQCAQTLSQDKNNSRRNRNRPQPTSSNAIHSIQKLQKEAQTLKRTLLRTYTGARLRKTFDWTLSDIEDDVSSFTQKLSVMELGLFVKGAAASHAYKDWKVHGSRKICMSEIALRTNVVRASAIVASNAKKASGHGVNKRSTMRRDLGVESRPGMKRARAY